MHEPSILVIIIPLDTHRPCKRRRIKRFLEMYTHIRGMWESCEGAIGYISRNFFNIRCDNNVCKIFWCPS